MEHKPHTQRKPKAAKPVAPEARSATVIAETFPKSSVAARFAVLLSFFALIVTSILLIERGVYGVAQNPVVDLNPLRAALSDQAQSIDTLNAAQKQMRNQLDNVQDALKHFMLQRGGEQQSWRLEEAQHLVRLADLTVQYSHDIPLAIQMLEAARARVPAGIDPLLINARESISEKIVRLKQIQPVDLDQVMAGLSRLNQLLPDLPLNKIQILSDQREKPAEPKVKAKTWRDTWAQNADRLRGLIVIRRSDTPQELLISPEQKRLLDLNIALYLQQAQWAALKRDETIYQESLKQVEVVVREYFDVNAESTKRYLTELAQLRAQTIAS